MFDDPSRFSGHDKRAHPKESCRSSIKGLRSFIKQTLNEAEPIRPLGAFFPLGRAIYHNGYPERKLQQRIFQRKLGAG